MEPRLEPEFRLFRRLKRLNIHTLPCGVRDDSKIENQSDKSSVDLTRFIRHCENLERLRIHLSPESCQGDNLHFMFRIKHLIEALNGDVLPHLTHLKVVGGKFRVGDWTNLVFDRAPTLKWLYIAPSECEYDSTGADFFRIMNLCLQTEQLNAWYIDFLDWGHEQAYDGSGKAKLIRRMKWRRDAMRAMVGAHWYFVVSAKLFWTGWKSWGGERYEEVVTEAERRRDFMEHFDSMKFD